MNARRHDQTRRERELSATKPLRPPKPPVGRFGSDFKNMARQREAWERQYGDRAP